MRRVVSIRGKKWDPGARHLSSKVVGFASSRRDAAGRGRALLQQSMIKKKKKDESPTLRPFNLKIAHNSTSEMLNHN